MEQGGRRAPRDEPGGNLSEFRSAADRGTNPASLGEPATPEAAEDLSDRAVRREEWGRGAGWRELTLGLAIFALYLVVTHRLPLSHEMPDAHGTWLLDVEKTLHIDVERGLNEWLAPHPVLGAIAAWEYATTYIVTTFGFLGWLWWRRRDRYRWARGVLATSTVIAIACFALWPLTPPRLLEHAGFTDVVTMHRPFLSWGSNTVSAGADQWAAMPSLHEAWAVWVTVVTLRGGAGRIGRSLAVLHLLVTSYVVVATGNHFVLDIVAGGVLVGVAMLVYPAWLTSTGWVWRHRTWLIGRAPDTVEAVESRRRRRAAAAARRAPIPAADAFFLHVESPEIPQVVGGVALLDTSGVDAGGQPHARPADIEPADIERVRALVARRLPEIPQLRRRVVPGNWRRRPRWGGTETVDLRYHVQSARLPENSGRRGLEQLVAESASRPLSLDHPPWRLWLVHGFAAGEAAMVVLVHHVVGDGIGVVALVRHLLDPSVLPEMPALPRRPGALTRAAASALGAIQLAADGRAQRLPLTGRVGPARVWRSLDLPFAAISRLAKASRTRVTDVLLTVFGEVIAELLSQRGHDARGRTLRVAVPITLRAPDDVTAGNITAALRIDVPLGPMASADRLAAVHAGAERRRRTGRVLATAAVIRAVGALPPTLHRVLARVMYQSRFFTAIFTNMPGPAEQMSFVGLPLKDVYPVIPLAEGVPLAAGTLGWNGRLCLSVTAEPELLPEGRDLDVRLRRAFERLSDDLGCPLDETERVAWPQSSA
jgi:hypothetical protein